MLRISMNGKHNARLGVLTSVDNFSVVKFHCFRCVGWVDEAGNSCHLRHAPSIVYDEGVYERPNSFREELL